MPSLTTRDDVPKIGGSEGGFIGLVVALGIIILASATVVFFLLRNQGGGGRGRGHVSNFLRGGRDGTFSTQKTNFNMDGIRNLFSGRKKGQKAGGWVQQVNDEHDFDSDSEGGIPMLDSHSGQSKGEFAHIPIIKPLPALSEDMSTVSLQAPGRLKSPISEPSPPHKSSPFSRPFSPQPKSTFKQVPANERATPIERKSTLDSMESTNSQYSQFSSGSKFHEHIDDS